MITFVTGEKNEGKTTAMSHLFQRYNYGAGFISPKRIAADSLAFYDIQSLADGQKIPFIKPLKANLSGWHEACKYGPYSFSQEGLDFGESILRQAVCDGASPLFIDEIGLLELDEHRGFYDILKELLQAKHQLFIAIRDSFLMQCIQDFGIAHYQMIKASDILNQTKKEKYD
jgi:nucleoside-triphosphatase THEP1